MFAARLVHKCWVLNMTQKNHISLQILERVTACNSEKGNLKLLADFLFRRVFLQCLCLTRVDLTLSCSGPEVGFGRECEIQE